MARIHLGHKREKKETWRLDGEVSLFNAGET